jgi:hypothetical protein
MFYIRYGTPIHSMVSRTRIMHLHWHFHLLLHRLGILQVVWPTTYSWIPSLQKGFHLQIFDLSKFSYFMFCHDQLIGCLQARMSIFGCHYIIFLHPHGLNCLMSIFLFILWKGIHLYDSYTIYCDKKLKSFKITLGTFNHRQVIMS